jgi:hypothetical protein
MTQKRPVRRTVYKNELSIEFSILTVLENNCVDDDTVTRHCVPCRLFLNQTCGKLKICEKDGTQLKCSCTAGWKYPTCGFSGSLKYDLSTYVKLFCL